MNDGGISIGSGLGGVAGGEPKAPKGVFGVGDANQADIEKFNMHLSGEKGAGEVGRVNISIDEAGPSGPFDRQTNRVKDSDIVGKKIGLGKLAVKETQGLISIGRNQEQEIMLKIKDARKNGYDTGTMLEMQYLMTQYTTLMDVVGKGVNKMVQAFQQAAKNQ